MKKTLCLLLSVILFFTLSAVNVFALDDSSLQSANDDETANEQAVDSMVVFGDSISAGFGLPDFDFNDNSKAAQSFPNLLCQRYHLTYGKNCFNFSHSGYDSAEILSDVKAADKGILKNADVVILALGTISSRSLMTVSKRNTAKIRRAGSKQALRSTRGSRRR